MALSPRSRRISLAGVTAAALAAATPLLAPVAQPATSANAPAGTCDPFRAPVLAPGVPTAAEVIGIDLGDRDVTTAESDRYLQAVADASPRVVDGVLGRSVEGRPLRYAVVGKPDWVRPRALKAIGHNLNRLRDADTPSWTARRIASHTPAVLWVAGNVHGGEESGTDASLRVLYELAARTDCTARTILDKAVVVVLPTQNPDGREADTRRNAYGFDLNRDWFARTQSETDGKVDKLRQLPPQLFIDAHEMGGLGNYFFPPNADPVYHDIGETPLSWIYELYGPTMQQAFQRFGIPYFNGDVYDLFYMGYGDTVPTTGFNAAGMTYEKSNQDAASVRMQEQYTAIWSSLFAAGERHSLLREWRGEHVLAASQGRQGLLEPNQLYWEGTAITNPVPDMRVRHYFVRPPGKAKAAELGRLVQRLHRMDIDVYQLKRSLRVPDFTPYGRSTRAVTLPRGTIWVPMAQGQKHWIQAMLNEDTYVPFPYFYDVTAFSGPLLNNLPGGYSGSALRPQAHQVRSRHDTRDKWAGGRHRDLAVWQISEGSSSAIESSGWLRWWLDHRLHRDYADLTAADIAGGALAGQDVLVIPNGSSEDALDSLGAAGQEALVDWVRGGGRLVTLRNASLLPSALGLTSATAQEPTSDIPGSLIRVEVNRRSPLADGVGSTAWAMVEYDLVWTAPAGAAPVRFPAAGDPDWFVSGFAEGEEQLYGTTAVVDQPAGDGRVVLFGFDPNYRAFTDGTAKILRNALLGRNPGGPGAPAAAPRAKRAADVVPASDRLVLTVDAGAAGDVRGLLARYGASAHVVESGDSVSFRVPLGGRAADEHPWATSLARDVAALGDPVVAVRLP